MTSWTHQMMSQQQQVVETTPGQSQKLFKTSETVNLTEKNPKWHNKVTKSPNVATRLFSWFLVSFACGVVEWICWMKQQSNTQKQGALTAIQTGWLCALHGSQSLTDLNS